MVKLYLDDIRNPPDDTWLLARSLADFKQLVVAHRPGHISFDHDLGESLETGLDAVNFLIEINYVPASFYVHSANIVGAENIRTKMNNWIAHNKKEENDQDVG